MTHQDFEFIGKLLQENCGVVLEAGKEYLVKARLGALLQELKLDSIADLVICLRQRQSQHLLTRIVEAMVTTETFFFRDHHPFEALHKSVLPELIERRRDKRRLNIWCAAASTGQEPYSVAMLLHDHFPELATWQVRLLGTDISDEMLTRCREAVYSQAEVNRGLPAKLLVKHFRQEGNIWRLNHDIRRMVEFQPLNLAQGWPPFPKWDLVLLRNVMIYFAEETKKAILGRLAHVLQPDGYLLLGSAETTFFLDKTYRRVEHHKTGFYQGM